MDDVLKELKIMNQRLTDLELQVREDREKILRHDKKFESLSKQLYDNPSKTSGHLNKTFTDFSFTSSSIDIQHSDVTLEDGHTTKPKGKVAAEVDIHFNYLNGLFNFLSICVLLQRPGNYV